ncbi:unnamed protein product [Musa hybrid cultivar]
MSKRKFGFEGFGVNRPATYNFERTSAPQRLYVPPSSRGGGHDNHEDADLDNIDYDQPDFPERSSPAGDDGEIDPLDAFMEGIQEEIRAPPPASVNPKDKDDKYKDDDEDDPVESFLRSKKDTGLTLASEALHAGYDSDEEVYAAAKAVDLGMVEYDSDDNPIVVDKRKIEPIPALDHGTIDYEPFNKDFYEEQPSISGMNEQEVEEYRKGLAIRVSGFDVPKPIKLFEECGFSPALMGAITKQGYEKPTTIQCQALPIVLSGRDVIGIAKTGSGKTAAFVLPMIVHIMDQPELDKGEGPIGVICAPTRELAHQIYLEARKFAKSYGIRVGAVYGGVSKLDQFKELKAGCEVVVATPGRLIDLLKMKALTMLRATYLVLDEADRMFDLGFEPQIRSIVGQIRPDRQTLLFSATMPYKVERLAREILSDPVRVTVGEVGTANEDITQVVNVISSDAEKMPWLLEKLPGMIDDGDVLVFASKKGTVDEIESQLIPNGFKIAALHGDKDQASRMDILQKFKSGIYHVLVATDVAARGLDIKSIKSVVNFDIARDMDMHVHRIGRTGRAGDKDGTAYTLITQKEARFAGELVNSLIAAGQDVPAELMDLAMKDGRFRAKRDARKGGKKGGRRGKGGNGSGRGVRGVDFGLGIGYNPDTANAATSHSVPSRSAAVNSLRTGMMAQFKSNFVAASSNSEGNISSTTRPSLSGFQIMHLGCLTELSPFVRLNVFIFCYFLVSVIFLRREAFPGRAHGRTPPAAPFKVPRALPPKCPSPQRTFSTPSHRGPSLEINRVRPRSRRRETPSVAGIVNPGSEGFQKLFFGQEEIAIPVHSSIETACTTHPTADVFINFASFRSAAASSMAALNQPTIRVVAIIAEGVPESDTKELIAYARANNKVVIGPATVGGIQAGAFRIGDTAGTLDNIIKCKLYRPGSVGFVSKSGGMSNELYNTIARVTDGIYEGIAIGGDVFPGSTLSDHVLRFNNIPQVKMMVVLGELGGRDEYSLVDALKEGKVQKPVIAWVSGTCARLFKSEVQFGHAGAKSGGELESAQAKNQALREAGAVVPSSYEAFENAIKETFEKLVEGGKIPPVSEVKPPQIPEDLKTAIKSGKVRAPTHIISTISDDRGEEPCYAGVPMSTIIERGYGVGDVISLLWFKRSLPRYCTQFIEICIMLCADHGPCVSGAHNTIVTARAGKDLVSSLVSGLLTIGPRFGGAIDDAARYFKDAYDKGLAPYEFVESMKKKGIRVPGIGHRIKSRDNRDKRVQLLQQYAHTHFPSVKYMEYAVKVETYTLSKANNLVLNVDGAIGSLFLDLLAGSGMFSKQEIDEIVEIGYLNGLFVLARSVGLIGHTFDQKRLKQPLYRHPWEDVLYAK